MIWNKNDDINIIFIEFQYVRDNNIRISHQGWKGTNNTTCTTPFEKKKKKKRK